MEGPVSHVIRKVGIALMAGAGAFILWEVYEITGALLCGLAGV